MAIFLAIIFNSYDIYGCIRGGNYGRIVIW